MQPTMQLTNLSPVQLQKKLSELDSREADIASREKLADTLDKRVISAQHDIKICNVQIEQLELTIVNHRKLIVGFENQEGQLQHSYDRSVALYRVRLEAQTEKMTTIDAQIKVARVGLKYVNDSIAERQAYTKTQESTIADVVELGSLKLRSLNYEVIEANQQLKDIHLELRTFNKDKQLLETDIEQMRVDFEQEAIGYEEKNITFNRVIISLGERYKTILAEVEIAKNDLLTATLETERKLEILKNREQEVLIKRETLKEEESSMIQKRRRMSSVDSLYGVE